MAACSSVACRPATAPPERRSAAATSDLTAPEGLVGCTVPVAALEAGARFTLPVPQAGPTTRYLGLRYMLGGTGPTVTARLQPRSLSSVPVKVYADAIGLQ